MTFLLIDYSELYFTKIKKIDMPARRSGKFIQIQNEAEQSEYLVFSPGELSVYHANVVERFCLLQGIIGSYYNDKKNNFEIHEHEWTVIGGGVWAINEMTKTLTLSGLSQVYGHFEAKGLKEKLLSSALVSGYIIKIYGQ
ncbi:MAG TPA: hypothetical protein VFG06_06405 [Thermodesulfovibrionales bacterium]|nr:hypothetical protein [Thermodesulfovibrionales bacterium]